MAGAHQIAPLAGGEVVAKEQAEKFVVHVIHSFAHIIGEHIAADEVERSTLLYVLDRVTTFFTSTTFKIIVASVVALIAILVAYAILINRKRAKRRKNRRH